MNLSRALDERFDPDWLARLRRAGTVAASKGNEAAVVGGGVRDLLLGRPTLDADVMLSPPAAPVVEALAQEWQAESVAHAKFLTFAIRLPNGQKVDVTTAREEIYERPGALPTVRPSTIPNDLKRRDFTINALAIWITPERFGELLDPFGGRTDLEGKVIRVLHAKSFDDDPTRVFRAARFAGRFGFAVERATLENLLRNVGAGGPAAISPTRRRHELELLLKEENPLPALTLLTEWGALPSLGLGWTLTPARRNALAALGDLPAVNRLVARLTAWFQADGRGEAVAALNALQFERAVKTRVLAALKTEREE